MPYYFDHAATSPIRQTAVDAWVAASSALNASAQYASGRKARSVLDDAREKVAGLMGCEPIEVIFTSNGTEANNLAIRGLYKLGSTNRIVSTPIEHPSVRETVNHLVDCGATADYMKVGWHGHFEDGSLELLDTPADVATMMMVNNETGAIFPVEQFIERAAAQGTPFHVDAVQVVGKAGLNFHELGATTLSASGHKFGAPRGTGFMLAKRSPAPATIMFGASQERKLRPGTVDVAGASALAAALEESLNEAGTHVQQQMVWRDKIVAAVKRIDGAVLHSHEPCMYSHVYVSFPGADADSLIMLLDMAGIEASSGSACHAGVNQMSHVLEAMGVSAHDAEGTLRFTMGTATTDEGVDYLIEKLPGIVEQARAANA